MSSMDGAWENINSCGLSVLAELLATAPSVLSAILLADNTWVSHAPKTLTFIFCRVSNSFHSLFTWEKRLFCSVCYLHGGLYVVWDVRKDVGARSDAGKSAGHNTVGAGTRYVPEDVCCCLSTFRRTS